MGGKVEDTGLRIVDPKGVEVEQPNMSCPDRRSASLGLPGWPRSSSQGV